MPERVETALAATFANLVHLQVSAMGLAPMAVSEFAVRANCNKLRGGIDNGSGEWLCTILWQGPERRPLRNTYELFVTTDGCYSHRRRRSSSRPNREHASRMLDKSSCPAARDPSAPLAAPHPLFQLPRCHHHSHCRRDADQRGTSNPKRPDRLRQLLQCPELRDNALPPEAASDRESGSSGPRSTRLARMVLSMRRR